MNDGRLFLAAMANGVIFEFEPARDASGSDTIEVRSESGAVSCPATLDRLCGLERCLARTWLKQQ